MRTVLNLHESQLKADWEYVQKEDRNAWQAAAAKTKGLVGPANFVTLAGAIMVIVGLASLYHNVTIWALILIGLGRLADVADGYVAAYTGTKSPIGAEIDAGTDKILALLALIVFILAGLAPLLILALIGLQAIANTLISIYAKVKRGRIIPVSQDGKLASAISWVVLVFYPLYLLLEENNPAYSWIFLVLAWVSFFGFLYFGLRATQDYYKQAVQTIPK